MRILLALLLFAFTCTALGQQKPATAPAKLPPGVTITDAEYPLPLAERDKIRDLQHENDEIEIENQKMQIKIEQNKARQSLLVRDMEFVATEFATSKHLDIGMYILDPAKISLGPKKTAKP